MCERGCRNRHLCSFPPTLLIDLRYHNIYGIMNTFQTMIGRRVAASLRSTGTMNPTFVATSYPPKTHCSLTRCPTLYFLCTNKHSSISTVCPGPPMTTGFLIKYSKQISLQKFFQSTMVCSPTIPRSSS